MNLDNFGLDTITFAGSLEAKLQATRAAGFGHIMLSTADIVGHPQGERAAVSAVRASGLRVTGLQMLRDFQGRLGHGHASKVDVAKAMLQMCRALGSQVLLACSAVSDYAMGDPEFLARDLRKLATLAVPLRVRIAYEVPSWGSYVNEFVQIWKVVQAADRSNLGIVLDSFHVLASGTDLEALPRIDPAKVFLVQLSDFMQQNARSPADHIEGARYFRVFPGVGIHSGMVADFVRDLHDMGYRGDYSFEVFNDDDKQLPPRLVAERARRSVKWLTGLVSRRSLPIRRPGTSAGL
jgi:sugar phosphate isomerase/epimerase